MLNMYDLSNMIAMGKSIFDIPLRVTYYTRVSSQKDAQLNSLENQRQFFNEFIEKNKQWTLVDYYVDKGIRGESAEKRAAFMEMISDSQKDKFDLILTKEISRFARNTLDSLKYTRELFRNNVGVYFLNDNICTLSGDGEMRLAIMSSIYQDEARKLSTRIKFGDKESMKKGVVFGNGRIYGYDKQDGKLIVNEDEAIMVKKIFDWYANQNLSTSKIEKLLYADGYRSRTGGRIAHATIGSIIKNPKYKGYYCGNKVIIEDYMTQKQRFLPEEDWILWKDEKGDTVPQIIDEELWEIANQKYKTRSEALKQHIRGKSNYSRDLWGRSVLSNKIFCKQCGMPYWRDVVSGTNKNTAGKEYWKCSGKKKNGTASCSSISLYLNDIEEILNSIAKDITPINEALLNEFVQIAERSMGSTSDNEKKIKLLKESVTKSNKKKSLLLDLYAEEEITKQEYIEQIKEIENKISQAEEEIRKYETLKEELKDVQQRIKNITRALKKLKEEQNYNMETVLPFIDQILVGTPNEKNELEIEIVLYDGTSRFSKFESKRSGHIIKNIYPKRQLTISRTNRHVVGYKDYYNLTILTGIKQ